MNIPVHKHAVRFHGLAKSLAHGVVFISLRINPCNKPLHIPNAEALVHCCFSPNCFNYNFAGCIGQCTPPQWNGNFRMVCGQGVPSYFWYKDGRQLNSSNYLVEEEERIVAVTNETRDPFGLYTCIASGVIRQWYLPELASGGADVRSRGRQSISGLIILHIYTVM